MLKHIFFYLFLAISGTLYANAQRSATPTLPSSLLCASPKSINLNAPDVSNFPSAGAAYIGFTFQAKITDVCAVGSNKFYFLVVSFNNGADRRLIDFAYDPTTLKLPVTIVGGAGSTINGDPGDVINGAALPSNTWVEFSATLDFTSKLFAATAGSSYGYALTQQSSLGFGGGWQFNITTKFYFCSDVGGANPFSCVVQGFRIWWDSRRPTWVSPQSLISETTSLFASYLMHDGTGNSLAAFTGSLGSGYLGDSATSPTATTIPTWSNNILTFTTTAQMVKFPPVNFLPANDLTPISFNMQVWIYLSSTPTSTSTILQITSQDGSNVWFNVAIGTDLHLIFTFNNIIQDDSNPLDLDTWYSIIIGFAVKANMKDYIATMSGYSNFALSGQAATAIPINAANNLITIGGFLGKVGLTRMFNPGGFSGSSADTGSNFGANPNQYARYCTNMYRYLYGETCVDSCPGGSYSISSGGRAVCVDCPAATPFTYNSQCYASCPTVAPLAHSSQCYSSCPAGASLTYNSHCYASCPSATYVSGSVCQDCPEFCSSCTSSSACTSCEAGYSLVASQCVKQQQQQEEGASKGVAAWVIGVSCAAGCIFLCIVISSIIYFKKRRSKASKYGKGVAEKTPTSPTESARAIISVE